MTPRLPTHAPAPPRVTIVHERFTEYGGAESVVNELAAVFPRARLVAPIFDDRVVPEHAARLDRSGTFLQKLYRNDGKYAHLLPLLPLAMRSVTIAETDVLISSHHSFANRLHPIPEIPTISYVHTPPRWMWDPASLSNEPGGHLARAGLQAFGASQRRFDRLAARRKTLLVANSSAVADRILQHWGCASEVIPPPVDVDYYCPDAMVHRRPFFLLAGRQVPYKRPDVAVAAATKAQVPLVVAGTGRALSAARRHAGPTVQFVEQVTNDQLRELYRSCQALIFTGVEDFGIIPVEAQACGAPVLGVDRGGLQDTVVRGLTGELVRYESDFDLQVDRMAEALRWFDASAYDDAVIRANAKRFSIDAFRGAMTDVVSQVVS